MLTAASVRLRQTGLSATDMARIAGENPYGKPIDVYVEKTTPVEVLLERAKTIAPGNRALTGHMVEAAIAKRYVYEATRPGRVLRIAQTARTYQHPSLAWAFATPDRFVFDMDPGELEGLPDRKAGLPGSADWLLECKLVGSFTAKEWDLREHSQAPDCDRVPPYVYVQVQWQMACTQTSRVDVAGIFNGTHYQCFRIDRDDGYIASLTIIGERFWRENVLARVPPPPDGSKSYARYLQQQYPELQPDIIRDPDMALDLFRAYQQAQQAERQAKADRERIGQLLARFRGSAKGIENMLGRATWTQSRGRVNWQGLAASLGAPEDPGPEWRSQPEQHLSIKFHKGR